MNASIIELVGVSIGAVVMILRGRVWSWWNCSLVSCGRCNIVVNHLTVAIYVTIVIVVL